VLVAKITSAFRVAAFHEAASAKCRNLLASTGRAAMC
jgi:hypothetical protein